MTIRNYSPTELFEYLESNGCVKSKYSDDYIDEALRAGWKRKRIRWMLAASYTAEDPTGMELIDKYLENESRR